MNERSARMLQAFIKGARVGAFYGFAVPFGLGIATATVTQDIRFLWLKIGESTFTSIAWPTVILFSAIGSGLHGAIAVATEWNKQRQIDKEYDRLMGRKTKTKNPN